MDPLRPGANGELEEILVRNFIARRVHPNQIKIPRALWPGVVVASVKLNCQSLIDLINEADDINPPVGFACFPFDPLGEVDDKEWYKLRHHGKEGYIGRPSDLNLTYFLKLKHVFRERTVDLLGTMRQDARQYLLTQTPPAAVDTRDAFERVNRAVVNAFVVDEEDYYVQHVLGSKHILRGIELFNKTVGSGEAQGESHRFKEMFGGGLRSYVSGDTMKRKLGNPTTIV
jgi:hypothetical protein